MQESSYGSIILLWRIWGAVIAVVCGVAISTLAGGQASAWASAVLLAALVVGVGVTAFVLLQTHLRARTLERSPRTPIPESEPLTKRQAFSDRAILEELVNRTGERDVDWLRFEEFSGLWRDDRTEGFRALAESDASRSGIFDPHLAEAAGRLTNAARAFFDVYDGETVADPIMPDGSWRMIGRVGANGAEALLIEADQLASQSRLSAAATEVIKQRTALLAIMSEVFPAT